MRLSAPASILALAVAAAAHMEMTDPPPLSSQHNPYASSKDYDMISPLASDGSDYPCKGYLGLLATADATAVATYRAGQAYAATLAGGATHEGGSCQFSLSLDNGASFRVIASYIGNCPSGSGARYDFTVPAGTPSHAGALLAWTWFNKVGNREMYMNCAVVDIEGTSGGSGGLSSRPEIFVANVANGCKTVDSADVMFPNPGPDVQLNDAGAVLPEGGDCDSGSGASGSSGSGGSDGGDSGWHWPWESAAPSTTTAVAKNSGRAAVALAAVAVVLVW
jgi:hypothetical protein